MELLETTPIPWAQGVGRSNRPAPTIDSKRFIFPLFGLLFARCVKMSTCFLRQIWATVSKLVVSDRTTLVDLAGVLCSYSVSSEPKQYIR